jgi:hypothetical protein
MVAAMSKKPKRGRPRAARTEEYATLSVRMTAPLRAALADAAARSRRSASTEIVLAIEHYLAAQGLWPPPPSPQARPEVSED